MLAVEDVLAMALLGFLHDGHDDGRQRSGETVEDVELEEVVEDCDVDVLNDACVVAGLVVEVDGSMEELCDLSLFSSPSASVFS